MEEIIQEVPSFTENQNTEPMKPKKKKVVRIHESDKIGVQIVVTVWVTLSIIFSFIPLFVTILNSLKSHSAIAANIFSFKISAAAIKSNYTTAFLEIYRPMLNSIVVAFVGAFFNMILGAIMAYIFSRKEFFGKEFFFKLYIMILLVPSIMGMPVLYDFISKLGLTNSYFGIWLPVIGGGQAGALFLFRTFFVQQPASIFESAKIDGANDVQIFIHFVIPLAFPILLLNFVGTFSAQYNDYLWSSLVLSSSSKMTLMPVIQARAELLESAQQRGAQYAMYAICSVPLIITTSLSLKHFQSGDFASGMKL
jgi:ABC-type glycerol-3-phosphate transport system permease component